MYFLFNPLSTTEIYTLSLHDALPILGIVASTLVQPVRSSETACITVLGTHRQRRSTTHREDCGCPVPRSEEHTSELQSQSNLVCRLLLEKKKLERNTRSRTEHTPHFA